MTLGMVQPQFSELSRQFEMAMAHHGFTRTNKETSNPIFFRELNEEAQVQFCELCQYNADEAAERMLAHGRYICGGLIHRRGFADEWEEIRKKANLKYKRRKFAFSNF